MQKKRISKSWNAWGETDPGKQRENNEDRILCDPERGIFVVADGMGGEAAGEVAAQQAVDFIGKRLGEEAGTAARRLREAIAGANNEIYRLAEHNPEWRGMACVLTAAIIENRTLHVGHVGDSRLYEIHGNGIRKITPDHSPIGQKEDSGELSELEAMRHPRRNEVFRDVGSQLHKPDDPDFIEYLQIPLEEKAAYVFCTDGLSDMLTSREILTAVIENAGRPQDGVRRLIEKANAAGGKDNISVLVVETENFAAEKGIREVAGILPSGFHRRWAFLFYGLLAGLLVSYAWLRPALNRPAKPEVPAVHLPGVLLVEPGSQQYPTITSALEAARAGDRIEIGNGEYEESIRLKEDVEISARAPGKVVLRISHALPDTDAAITAEGIRRAAVTGLTIQAEPAAGLPFGIRLSNSDVNVSNMEVSGAMRAGMLIDGNSEGAIIASYVHANAGPGILIAGSANPLMIGNLFYANGTGKHTSPGLYVTENSNPEVKRNIFSGNGAEAIRLQRPELKDRMTDNLFVNSGKQRKAISVERISR